MSQKKNKCSGESTTTTIESLPDSVLRHILSFLPTKEAVPICLLLSKRWEPLWLELRSLHFDETYHPDYDNCSWYPSRRSQHNSSCSTAERNPATRTPHDRHFNPIA
ncbi:F-box/LRR-repeat protein [Trifolium medium]|uniref:F-box/LRR-repeat protein n=1 Tax=Trifolium medium TaxID=97028 RepID=A0A392PT47_9FABA|nr:F-box/LRR-repeat protein [Trifolium medium]